MSTGRHSETDPQTNRLEITTPRTSSATPNTTDVSTDSPASNMTDSRPPHDPHLSGHKPSHDPHLSGHVPVKREGTHRTIEMEPVGSKKPSLPSATVEEKTTSSTKEQVRNIERTSDLQREIPRLLEQKRQTLQAQKTFFVTEHYDEWQDTFISAEENPLPADFFEMNPEALPADFFEANPEALPADFFEANPEVPPADFFEVNPETLPPELFANQIEEETLDVRPEQTDFPTVNPKEADFPDVKPEDTDFSDVKPEDTDFLNVRPEDTDFPDILDIGEVKTSDDAHHDTVILKVPDKS